MSTDTKRCTECGELKPVDEFPVRTVRGKRGPAPRCRICLRALDRERQQRYRSNNPDKARTHSRDTMRRTSARRAGLTEERAQQLRDGPCGVCGTSPNEGCQLYQDKATGAVLGALCHTCSRGLAMLGGTSERLRSALSFVQSGADHRDIKE